MEADKDPEEPSTTLDTTEHPSSKDPSTEDLLEPPISETPLEPSISQTPLEPHASEAPYVPSTSQTPLEPHASESLLEPSVPETPLEPHTSEHPLVASTSQAPLEPHTSEHPLVTSTSQSHLEPSTSEHPLVTSTFHSSVEPNASEHLSVSSTPLIPSEPHTSENTLKPSIYVTSLEKSTSVEASTSKTHISEVPDTHTIFQPSPEIHVSGTSSDSLQKDFLSEFSSSEGPKTRKSTQDPEIGLLPKDSLPGPSAHFPVDISSKQEEKAEEDQEGMDTSDISAHRASPESQLGKKKGKKGISRYTGHPVVPAKQAELVDVAKAMHRERFGAQLNHLFQWEKNAALNAIQTGLYIGWRCPHYLWDCFRIGNESKCFCGHLLREHQIISDISVPCAVSQCRCLMFCFIPSCPEEVGEFWLRKRATFDPKAWRAQCRCKHSHEDHAATGAHPCRHRGCSCKCFESNFLCAACDRRWEEHETFFETQETRRRGGRPHGADYVPFAEMPVLQEAILNSSDFEALQMQGPSGHPHPQPSPPAPPVPHSHPPGPTPHPHT